MAVKRTLLLELIFNSVEDDLSRSSPRRVNDDSVLEPFSTYLPADVKLTFKVAYETRGLQVQDVITEIVADWVEANSPVLPALRSRKL